MRSIPMCGARVGTCLAECAARGDAAGRLARIRGPPGTALPRA